MVDGFGCYSTLLIALIEKLLLTFFTFIRVCILLELSLRTMSYTFWHAFTALSILIARKEVNMDSIILFATVGKWFDISDFTEIAL